MSGVLNAARVRRFAGAMLALMIGLAIVHGLHPAFASWPAGLAAWLAGIALVPRVAFAQKIQLGALTVLGIVSVVFASSLGAQPQWLHILDANAALLTMIAAVSFLRLVAMASSPVAAQPPVGKAIYRQTMLGVGLFGAFINISAPILIADRLAEQTKLSRFASQSITRVFSGCSAWSPFFGGMAVVLTYVSDTDLVFVMLAGIPFAVVGFALVIAEAHLRYRSALDAFTGYPVAFASLWIPAVLALAVITGAAILPRTSILLVIAMAALVVTSLVLIVRHGALTSLRRLSTHVFEGLPGMVGELLLFLAAGILAVGLSALAGIGDLALPIMKFGAVEASGLLGLMVFVSALGLHPVITIAAVTPMLSVLNPNPQLLAVTYLLGWSLGTCASPLSGTHLIFQGRYGVPSIKGAMWNWPFASIMYGFGVILLSAVDYLQTLSQ